MPRVIAYKAQVPNYGPKAVSPRLLTCVTYLSQRLGSVYHSSLQIEGQDPKGDPPDR